MLRVFGGYLNLLRKYSDLNWFAFPYSVVKTPLIHSFKKYLLNNWARYYVCAEPFNKQDNQWSLHFI